MNQELKAVWEVYKPFKKHLYVSFIGLAIAKVLSCLYPYVYGKALNVMIYKEGIPALAYTCLGLLALILTEGFVSQYRENNELKYLDYDLKRSMRSKTSAKMLGLSIGQHHSEHSGVKFRIVSEGESAVTALFKLTTYDVAPMLFEVLFCAIGCVLIDWKIGTIVALTLVLMYSVSKKISNEYSKPINAQDRSDDKTTKLAREIISNVELIKLNSKEAFAVAEQDRMLGEVSEGWKKIWIPLNNILWNRALLPRTMKIIVMFFAGVRAYQGDISYGSLFILWRLSENCLGRIGTINYFQRAYMSFIPRISRYVEFLQVLPDINNAPNALKVPKFFGEIEFRNVSFRYPTKPLMSEDKEEFKTPKSDPDREFAVQDASFTLEPGRSYALVGTSGSGKSTIKHLGVRSYDPTSGLITVDGYPLTHLDLDLLRARIGVVDQEVPLLDRTLRENLLFLLPEGVKVTDERIMEACKMACIDRFYHRLNQGLDTYIGERGVKLSGGEKQRVAIARAILKNPDIYVFDEATSSLDSLNEDDIVKSIKAVSKGKTTLMIAHRFSTILSADEIIVMDQGRVVGQGTHKELYEKCPEYTRLVGPQIRIVERLALV